MSKLSIEEQIKEERADKPYQSLSSFLKKEYGEKIFKISLDGGFTCPNRDGLIGHEGCIFCSEGGSGEFATLTTDDESDIHDQIMTAISKFGSKNTGSKYIAYFQAYTNTYGKPEHLYKLYRGALTHPLIKGISIGTRPDCLGPKVLEVLKRVKQEFSDKFIWVELGLQTIHESTAKFIRRGYSLSVFDEAVTNLHALSIPIIVHMILGLPGETDEMVLQTVSHLNKSKVFGVKLQLLHILKNTDLEKLYLDGKIECLTKEHYIDLLIQCIDHLDPNIVLHRVTGDGAKDLLIAPQYSLYKWDMLNSLHREMRTHGHYQGRLFNE